MISIEWTVSEVLAATALYWVLLVAAWYVYTTRPSVQARARERGYRGHFIDDETGEMAMLFELRTNYARVGLALFGLPFLLVLIRLTLGS